jgi:hypothetical protein
MNKLLRDWNAAKLALEKAKTDELALREKVIAEYPGDQGTSHTEGSDFKLTIVRGVTRSVDEAELSGIWDKLSELEKACVKYKPSLDAKLFDKLPAKNKLSRAVTVKPSLPSVKLEVYEDGPET